MKGLRSAFVCAACVGAAAPVLAFEQMTAAECRASLDQMFDLVGPNDAQLAAVVAAVTAQDGWCRIAGADLEMSEGEVDLIEWRMEDTARWTVDGIPPLALDLRLSGLDPDALEGEPDLGRPDLDLEVTLRQEPEAGLVILERLFASNAVGDALSVSGVFERVFLTSPSMMQVSLGSATFKAGLVSMTLEGKHENPFAFRLDVDVQGGGQAQSEGAFDLISRLPEGVIDDASRAELTAFAGDLPGPVGTLEVSVASERGLGLMQVGMSAFLSIQSALDGETEADKSQLEVMLDGLTLRADWTPAAQVAD